MKLLLCRICQDVRKLQRSRTRCDCGRSWGMYLNDLNAEYHGPCIPIGFDNHELHDAVLRYIRNGSLGCPKSDAVFSAFVMSPGPTVDTEGITCPPS